MLIFDAKYIREVSLTEYDKGMSSTYILQMSKDGNGFTHGRYWYQFINLEFINKTHSIYLNFTVNDTGEKYSFDLKDLGIEVGKYYYFNDNSLKILINLGRLTPGL